MDTAEIRRLKARLKTVHGGALPTIPTDHDGGGDVNFAEFVSAIRRCTNLNAQQLSTFDLQRLFAAVDVAGEGTIGIEDFNSFMNSGPSSAFAITSSPAPKRGGVTPVEPAEAALMDYLRLLYTQVHTEVGGQGTVTRDELLDGIVADIVMQFTFQLTDGGRSAEWLERVDVAFAGLPTVEGPRGASVAFDAFLQFATSNGEWGPRLREAVSIEKLSAALFRTQRNVTEEKTQTAKLQQEVDRLRGTLTSEHLVSTYYFVLFPPQCLVKGIVCWHELKQDAFARQQPLLEQAVHTSETLQRQLAEARADLASSRTATLELAKAAAEQDAKATAADAAREQSLQVERAKRPAKKGGCCASR